jgi:hypothetical protein
MLIGVEPIAEKLVHMTPAKLTGGQADVMNDQCVDRDTGRALVKIHRLTAPRIG